MAIYQIALRAKIDGAAPGLQAVRALKHQLPHFGAQHRSSVLTFLGAWHGLHGEPERVEGLLRAAGQAAESVRSPHEASYLGFLADFRFAEFLSHDEQGEMIERAKLWLPELGPIHQALARELLKGLRRGLDRSIRTNVAE